jgi:hypothetical protein
MIPVRRNSFEGIDREEDGMKLPLPLNQVARARGLLAPGPGLSPHSAMTTDDCIAHSHSSGRLQHTTTEEQHT